MTTAYDKTYLEKARNSLGNMLDFSVNVLRYDLRNFWNEFLTSDISKHFAGGDSATLAGKSGIELAYSVLKIENAERLNVNFTEDKSPEYWAGWALAYYQWSCNISFEKIDEIIPIETVVRMYFPYHEMDIRQFCDRMNEIMNKGNTETKLKSRRRMLGLTQKELAEETGVPLRTVQQYEQGQKSLKGARAEYVIAFSKALYCRPEDILPQ